MAKTLIFVGIVFILIGICFQVFGKIPGVGRLPGDIFVKRDNFNFYFPLTTCILISTILSFIFFLWNQK